MQFNDLLHTIFSNNFFLVATKMFRNYLNPDLVRSVINLPLGLRICNSGLQIRGSGSGSKRRIYGSRTLMTMYNVHKYPLYYKVPMWSIYTGWGKSHRRTTGASWRDSVAGTTQLLTLHYIILNIVSSESSQHNLQHSMSLQARCLGR